MPVGQTNRFSSSATGPLPTLAPFAKRTQLAPERRPMPVGQTIVFRLLPPATEGLPNEPTPVPIPKRRKQPMSSVMERFSRHPWDGPMPRREPYGRRPIGPFGNPAGTFRPGPRFIAGIDSDFRNRYQCPVAPASRPRHERRSDGTAEGGAHPERERQPDGRQRNGDPLPEIEAAAMRGQIIGLAERIDALGSQFAEVRPDMLEYSRRS